MDQAEVSTVSNQARYHYVIQTPREGNHIHRKPSRDERRKAQLTLEGTKRTEEPWIPTLAT